MQASTRARAEPRSQPSVDQEALTRLARARRQRLLATIGIRVAALAVVLTLWEVLGRQINPVLFAPPSAVAAAAVELIGSGELWRYLSQSLRLMIGLPDYGAYLRHAQAQHPDVVPMSYEEFFCERQQARYAGKGRMGRCC